MRNASRRTAFLGFAAALTLLRPATASAQAASATTRKAAWTVGSQLSLAALLHGQGAQQELVDRSFARAETIGKLLGVERVPPLPQKAATSAATQAEIIQYLIKGEGAQIGAALGKRYDPNHTILFELAIKSNLLILLYAPGSDSGLGQVVQDRSQRLNLPPETWTPLVEAIKAKKSHDEVKSAVFAMHAAVFKHLSGPT